MKFIGYKRIKGNKDGKEWDFVQLVIVKAEEKSGPDAGGAQLLMQRKSNGFGLPTIQTEVFLKALKSGVEVGDEVRLYQDFEGNVVLEPAK